MAAPNLWYRPGNPGSMQSSPATLLSFRAGKCRMEGTRVIPDARKGLFQMIQDPEGFKHIQWKDRTTGRVEDDFYVLADVDFKRVPQSNGRVFLLLWQDNANKLFYWMQEPDAERDEELFSRVNAALSDGNAEESTTAEEPSASASAPAATPATDSREQALSSSSQITSEQLQSIFQRMAPQIASAEAPSIGELLNPNVVLPILRDPAIEESLQGLVQHLPEDDSSPEAIAELLRTPQFRQQVHALSQALQSGQAGELLRSFGIDAEANENGMAALLQGLLRYQAEARGTRKPEDDPMDES